MTFDPRARTRELSATVAVQSTFAPEQQLGPTIERLVESALLAFAREVLTQEPDEGMTNSVVRAHKANRHSPYVFTYEDIVNDDIEFVQYLFRQGIVLALRGGKHG